jgi:hypothetical protein
MLFREKFSAGTVECCHSWLRFFEGADGDVDVLPNAVTGGVESCPVSRLHVHVVIATIRFAAITPKPAGRTNSAYTGVISAPCLNSRKSFLPQSLAAFASLSMDSVSKLATLCWQNAVDLSDCS